MNRSLLGRIVPFLFGFYAVAFAAFLLYSFLTFSATAFLPALRWEYALKNGFLLFMEYLVPVHAAAIAVAASLSGGAALAAGTTSARPNPFNRVVSSTIAVFIVLAVGYALLFEVVSPQAHRRISDMRYLSGLARELERQATAAAKAGDYLTAVDAQEAYVSLTKDRKAVEKLLVLRGQAAKQKVPPPARPVAGLAGSEGLDAQALYERARSYAAQEDWMSAHYYAQQAVALDPRRTDIQALATEAWNHLGGATGGAAGGEATPYKKKKAAYDRLIGNDPLGAYYDFLALAKEYKGDPDISRYLEEARGKVAKSSFFVDEARALEVLPGVQQILFLDHTADGATVAVSIGKMVELEAGTAYFYDIEAVRYLADGAVAWHFTAPYGTLVDSSILMRAVDKTDSAKQYAPIFLAGSRPAADRNLLSLRPGPVELRALSVRRNAMADTGLADLWRMRGTLGSLGMSRQALNVELTMRLLMPFAFLIVSLFALALGWAFRLRTVGRLPFFTAILTPLVPVVLAVLTMLYLYAHRVVAGLAVVAFGLSPALVVLAVLQAVLLAVSLVVLAGQTTR
jgi:tetratricopeptide (TPR) repeat protein